jgi:hypothetical protein
LEVELLVLEAGLVEEVQSLLGLQLVASAVGVAHTGHLAAERMVQSAVAAVACKDWAQLVFVRVERRVQPKADFQVQAHIGSKEPHWMLMEVAGMGTLRGGPEAVQGWVMSILLLAVIGN